MQLVTAGVIGFGKAGETYIGPFLASSPDKFSVKKVCTSSSERSNNALSLFPQCAVVSDPSQILNDPDIQLVVVASSNESHYELSKKALLCGKHVLVEKPMTVTYEQGLELISLASCSPGTVLCVHHNRVFDSGLKTIKKIIESNRLGTILEMEMHYDRYRKQSSAVSWRETSDTPGSGLLYDLGPHLIYSALELFGEPDELCAFVCRQRPQASPNNKCDDNFEIILFYSNNLKVTLKAGMQVLDPPPVYRITGDLGTFVKYGMDVQEEALKRKQLPSLDTAWGVEPSSIYGKLTTVDDTGNPVSETIASEPGSYQDLYNNLYDAIINSAPLVINAKRALATIRIIELAQQSSTEKRTVKYSK